MGIWVWFVFLFFNILKNIDILASPVAQQVKNLLAVQKTLGSIPELRRILEEGMATHSNILAWRIPWTAELGRLQSMGLQIVTDD